MPIKLGRPNEYRADYIAIVERLMLLGATEFEVCEALRCSKDTLWKWARERPEFLAALKTRKEGPDERVIKSLYHRAIGYSFKSEEIHFVGGSRKPIRVPITVHVPPDVTACIFWLKNRQRADWRDRQELDVMGEIKVVEEPSDREVAKALSLLLEQRKRKLAATDVPPEEPDGSGRK